MCFPAWGCLGNGYSCCWEADGSNFFLSNSMLKLSCPLLKQERAGSPNTQAGAAWPALLAGLELFLLPTKQQLCPRCHPCSCPLCPLIPISGFLFPQRELSKASRSDSSSRVLNSTTTTAFC